MSDKLICILTLISTLGITFFYHAYMAIYLHSKSSKHFEKAYKARFCRKLFSKKDS